MHAWLSDRVDEVTEVTWADCSPGFEYVGIRVPVERAGQLLWWLPDVAAGA